MLLGARQLFSVVKKSDEPKLPSGYERVQFVDTNGDLTSGDAKKTNSAAAFNTGVTPNSSTVLRTVVVPGNNGTGEWETFIGGSNNGDAQSGAWLLRRNSKVSSFSFGLGSWSTAYYVSSSLFTNGTSVCEIEIALPSSATFVIDGVKETKTITNGGSFSGVGPLWIGASGRRSYGNSYRGCRALFGRTTILSGRNVLRDYIPARRKSDSVCGFYDVANNEFKMSQVSNHVFTAASLS